MSTSRSSDLHPPGSARLRVVIPAAAGSFFYAASLDYSLPLYFGAQTQYPYDMWAQLIALQVTPWLFAPILAGVLSRRFGERTIWSVALFCMALVPAALLFTPSPWLLKLIAFWQGTTGALMWIAGVSLVQMVAPKRKGFSNGLMMASLGAGSILGPLAARAILYHREFSALLHAGELKAFWSRLFSLAPTQTVPTVGDFSYIFSFVTVTTMICGVGVALWGQRAGVFAGEAKPNWSRIKQDVRELMGNPRFWALVLIMCGIGGPIFQAANQFLPYRADDVGLKNGAVDQGWLWLQLLKTFMWLPGGLAVGLVAGRRAPGYVGAGILALFSLTALAIGGSRGAAALFGAVALFEFVRQFMRWSHAGYLSEHMPDHLRATAIGFSITISGCSSTIYAWLAATIWKPGSPGFNSSQPFWIVSLLGLGGVVALVVFDRFIPIRQTVAAAAPLPPSAVDVGAQE